MRYELREEEREFPWAMWDTHKNLAVVFFGKGMKELAERMVRDANQKEEGIEKTEGV